MSSAMLKTLSVLRMVVGSSTLLLPRTSGPLFGFPAPPETIMLGRLFGARDFVLGAFLWKTLRDWNAVQAKGSMGNSNTTYQRSASFKASVGGAEGTADHNATATSIPILRDEMDRARTEATMRRHDLSTALWLGMICDCIDVGSAIACTFEGNISDLAKVTAGLGAAVFAMIGAYGIRSLRNGAGAE